MPPSLVRRREPVPRRLCAAVIVLALGSSGCAVHTWKPAADPGLASLRGETVRAVCRGGDVEMTLDGYSAPHLVGTCLRTSNPALECDGPVSVDLGECLRVDVQRVDDTKTVAYTLAALAAVPLVALGALVVLYVFACDGGDC